MASYLSNIKIHTDPATFTTESVVIANISAKGLKANIMDSVREILTLIAQNQEIRDSKDVRKFFRLFKFCSISSSILDSFILTNPWAQSLKRTYEWVRLINEQRKQEFETAVYASTSAVDLAKLAKHAIRQKDYAAIMLLLDRNCTSAQNLLKIVNAFDANALRELVTTHFMLFVQLTLTCLYWGNFQKLHECLDAAGSFPWHDIDIEMGCIFENLCYLADENIAVKTLRTILSFGYNPFVNCRSCSTLYDYAELSRNSKLHKLVIEEILLLPECIDDDGCKLPSFLYGIFKDEKNLVSIFDLNLVDIKKLMRGVQSSIVTPEQFRVLFPLLLPHTYPLNAKRPDYSDSFFASLQESLKENSRMLSATMPTDQIGEASLDRLDTLKFLWSNLEDQFIYVKKILDEALNTSKEEYLTSWLKVYIYRLNKLSVYFLDLQRSYWQAHKNQKSASPLEWMHRTILYGSASELTGLVTFNQIDVNAPINFDVEHSAFVAVREGQREKIKIWLEAGGNPNLSNSVGETLLGIACHKLQYEIAELLINAGAVLKHIFTVLNEDEIDEFSLVEYYSRQCSSVFNQNKINMLRVLLLALVRKRCVLEDNPLGKEHGLQTLKSSLVKATLKFLGLQYGGYFLRQILGPNFLYECMYGAHSYALRRYIYEFSNESIVKFLKYVRNSSDEQELIERNLGIEAVLSHENYIQLLYCSTFRNDEDNFQRLFHTPKLILDRINHDQKIYKVHHRILLTVFSELLFKENSNKVCFEEAWESFPSDKKVFKKCVQRRMLLTRTSDVKVLIFEKERMNRFVATYTWMEHVVCYAQSISQILSDNKRLEKLKKGYREFVQRCNEHITLLDQLIDASIPLPQSFTFDDLSIFIENLRCGEDEQTKSKIESLSRLTGGQEILFKVLIHIFSIEDEDLVEAYEKIVRCIIEFAPQLVREPSFVSNEPVIYTFLTVTDYLPSVILAVNNGYKPSIELVCNNLIHIPNDYLKAFKYILCIIFDNASEVEKKDFIKSIEWDNYYMSFKLAKLLIIEIVLQNSKNLERLLAQCLYNNRNCFSKNEMVQLLAVSGNRKTSELTCHYKFLEEQSKPFELEKVFPDVKKRNILMFRIMAWIKDPSEMRVYRTRTSRSFSNYFRNHPIPFFSESLLSRGLRCTSMINSEAEDTCYSLISNTIALYKRLSGGLLVSHRINQPQPPNQYSFTKENIFAFILSKRNDNDTALQNRCNWVLRQFADSDPFVESFLNSRVSRAGYGELQAFSTVLRQQWFGRRSSYQADAISLTAHIIFTPLAPKERIIKFKHQYWQKSELLSWGNQLEAYQLIRCENTGCTLSQVEGEFMNSVLISESKALRFIRPKAENLVKIKLKDWYEDDIQGSFEVPLSSLTSNIDVELSEFSLFAQNICSGVNRDGKWVHFSGAYNVLIAYASINREMFYQRYSRLIQEKHNELEKQNRFTDDCLKFNVDLLKFFYPHPEYLKQALIKREIVVIEVIKDLISKEFSQSMHFIQSGLGIDQRQLDTHINEYLNTLPNGTVILHSYRESIKVLEIAMRELVLSRDEGALIAGFLESAQEFEVDEEKDLNAIEEEIKSFNFKVVRVPGLFIRDDVQINFFRGAGAGTNGDEDYYECSYSNVPGEEILRDAFSLYLKRQCGIDKVLFYKDAEGVKNSKRI